VSRPRRLRSRSGGVPDWLAVYRPQEWAEDPGDELAVNYGRIRWAAARRVWLEGGDPEPYQQPPEWSPAESPRVVQGGSVYTAPVWEKRAGGVRPQVNRAAVEPRARPIRLR
jgi:hypothetical protein